MDARSRLFNRAGAVAYVVWGVLHLGAALSVYTLSTTVDAGHVQGRLVQDAWNLGLFAVLAIVVAVTLNRHGSRTGYWLNLAVVGAADLGFLLFVVAPGHVPLVPDGITGPGLWLLAAVLTTLGLRTAADPVSPGRRGASAGGRPR